MKNLAERLNLIEPSPTLAITAYANQLKSEGKDVVGFGAGEPDFDTPDHIKNAAIDAIKKGHTKYTAVQGIPALRQAVTEKLKRENNLDYTPAQVCVGVGGKQVLYNIFMALLNPGDEVVIPGPYWVSYKDMVMLATGKAVIIETSIDKQFKMNAEQLKAAITPKTKAVIINSPSNPTGAAYSKTELESFAAVLQKYPDIWIITDDIYEKLLYDGLEFFNIAMLDKELVSRTIIVNGLSKAYSMTGWRLGYVASRSQELVDAVTMLQGQSTSNAVSFAQYGGVEALRGDQGCVDTMKKSFKERRDYAYSRLSAMAGLKVFKPQGAFYIFPDFSKAIQFDGFQRAIKNNPEEKSYSKIFSSLLLKEKLVAVVSGSAFGYDNGFRISYATSMEQIVTGLDRMEEFMIDLQKG